MTLARGWVYQGTVESKIPGGRWGLFTSLISLTWHIVISFASRHLCTYQCQGQLIFLQNKFSIIPTVRWNSHIKCPYPQDGIETFSVWKVCLLLLNSWCIISCFSTWQLSRSGEQPSAVLHIHQETWRAYDNWGMLSKKGSGSPLSLSTR